MSKMQYVDLIESPSPPNHQEELTISDYYLVQPNIFSTPNSPTLIPCNINHWVMSFGIKLQAIWALADTSQLHHPFVIQVAVYRYGALAAFSLEGVHRWIAAEPQDALSYCIRLKRDAQLTLQSEQGWMKVFDASDESKGVRNGGQTRHGYYERLRQPRDTVINQFSPHALILLAETVALHPPAVFGALPPDSFPRYEAERRLVVRISASRSNPRLSHYVSYHNAQSNFFLPPSIVWLPEATATYTFAEDSSDSTSSGMDLLLGAKISAGSRHLFDILDNSTNHQELPIVADSFQFLQPLRSSKSGEISNPPPHGLPKWDWIAYNEPLWYLSVVKK